MLTFKYDIGGYTFLEVILALFILAFFGLGVRLFENKVVHRLNRYKVRFREYDKLQQFTKENVSSCLEPKEGGGLKAIVCSKKGLEPQKAFPHTFLLES